MTLRFRLALRPFDSFALFIILFLLLLGADNSVQVKNPQRRMNRNERENVTLNGIAVFCKF